MVEENICFCHGQCARVRPEQHWRAASGTLEIQAHIMAHNQKDTTTSGTVGNKQENNPVNSRSLGKVCLALVISFFVISILGGTFIFFSWKSSSLSIAYEHGIAFFVIIAAVHFLGFKSWQRQQKTKQSITACNCCPPSQSDIKITDTRKVNYKFFPALKFGVIVQIAIFVLTALVLDGGELNRLCTIAIIGYWIGVGIILLRRDASITKIDILFIRYGVVVLLIMMPLIAKLVYGIIGESIYSGLERLTSPR
jgi:hypothetical protein